MISSGRDDGKHGVGFLLSENFGHYIEWTSEWITGIDLKLFIGVSIIQVYAPQQGRPVAEKKEFYGLVQETMDDMKYQQNIIMCGEWNW